MGGDLIDRYDAAFTRLAKSKFRSQSLPSFGSGSEVHRRQGAGDDPLPLRGLHPNAPRSREPAERREADADARASRVQGAARLRLLLLGTRLRSACSLPHGSQPPSRGGYTETASRSGNAPAPQASGCPTNEVRSLAKQGRKRPRTCLAGPRFPSSGVTAA